LFFLIWKKYVLIQKEKTKSILKSKHNEGFQLLGISQRVLPFQTRLASSKSVHHTPILGPKIPTHPSQMVKPYQFSGSAHPSARPKTPISPPLQSIMASIPKSQEPAIMPSTADRKPNTMDINRGWENKNRAVTTTNRI
jgi:hypothetical protein